MTSSILDIGVDLTSYEQYLRDFAVLLYFHMALCIPGMSKDTTFYGRYLYEFSGTMVVQMPLGKLYMGNVFHADFSCACQDSYYC